MITLVELLKKRASIPCLIEQPNTRLRNPTADDDSRIRYRLVINDMQDVQAPAYSTAVLV